MDIRIIDPKKLDKLHIRAMSEFGTHITWQEFARTVGVSANTLSNIRNQRTTGSVQTLKKIVKRLNQTGIPVKEDELLKEVV